MCSGGFPSQQQGATRAADEIVSRGRAVYQTGRERLPRTGTYLPNRGNFGLPLVYHTGYGIYYDQFGLAGLRADRVN